MKIPSCLILIICCVQVSALNTERDVHPGYDLIDLRPEGFEPRVGGMDFLPDGRLVICDWVDSDTKTGKVQIVSGINGTGPSQVSVKTVVDTLWEPLGVKVIDDLIYVVTKRALYKISDFDESPRVEVVYDDWYNDFSYYHHFNFGFVHMNNSLYISTGAYYKGGKWEPDRGDVLRFPLDNGSQHEVIAGGLRSPNGINTGPENKIFVTENQGHRVSTSSMFQIQKDDFYGFPGGDSIFIGKEQVPPAVYFPHGECMESPSEPILVPSGHYKGQMLVGDMVRGKMRRIFLEKIADKFQGAVFPFSAGFEAGPNRLRYSENGELIVGGIGSRRHGSWSWNDKFSGLQKMVPNGTKVFEMSTVKSLSGSEFEIEFSMPANSEAGKKDNYKIEQYNYGPTNRYGGPKLNEEELTVSAANLLEDGKKVRLSISGLKEDRIVAISLDDNIKSSQGEKDIWGDIVWYTLNKFGPSGPVNVHEPEKRLNNFVSINQGAAGYEIKNLTRKRIDVEILNLQGKSIYKGVIQPAKNLVIQSDQFFHGISVLNIKTVKGVQTQILSSVDRLN